jgi:hypothetical protein
VPGLELGAIDRALAQRTIRLGRFNRRPGRCVVWACHLFIPFNRGRHLWIDGKWQGLVCLVHEKYILRTAQEGKEEL